MDSFIIFRLKGMQAVIDYIYFMYYIILFIMLWVVMN